MKRTSFTNPDPGNASQKWPIFPGWALLRVEMTLRSGGESLGFFPPLSAKVQKNVPMTTAGRRGAWREGPGSPFFWCTGGVGKDVRQGNERQRRTNNSKANTLSGTAAAVTQSELKRLKLRPENTGRKKERLCALVRLFCVWMTTNRFCRSVSFCCKRVAIAYWL